MTKPLSKALPGFHISLGSFLPPNSYTTQDLECSLKIILFYVVKSLLGKKKNKTITGLCAGEHTTEDTTRKGVALVET